MKRLLSIILVFVLVLTVPAQTQRTTSKKRQTTTTTGKKTSSSTTQKTTTTKKKTTATTKRKSATTTKKSSRTKRKTTTASSSSKSKTTTYTNSSIKGLQNKRSKLQSSIKKQEQALRANKANVKKGLQNLISINTEIDRHKKNIDNIEKDISTMDGDIRLLNTQLETLQKQLDERKSKYVKSMRYITRQHTVEDKLMFIFSAESFSQMYRRLRFVREYASFQRAQGEAVKTKQAQVDVKRKQLETAKSQKNTLLNKGKKERQSLEEQQTEQQKAVNSLQKQQKTIQQIIAKQRKEDAALNRVTSPKETNQKLACALSFPIYPIVGM